MQLRVREMFRYAWILIGLIFVSCSAIPGALQKTAVTQPPGISSTSSPQPSVKLAEPVYSLDLSANQGKNIPVTSVKWLPDGKFALAGSSGISLYEAPKAGIQPRTAPAMESQMVAQNPTLLTSSPDGLDLAWISADRKVVYWDTAGVSVAEDITASEAPITGLVINPDKTNLAYSTYNGDVFIWGIDAQKVMNSWKKDSWMSDLSFSPDGQYLAGVDLANFTASIYTQDGQIFKQLEWKDPVYPALTGAFFSPDWKKVSWVAQSAVQIMDVTTGDNTFLLSHSDVVSSIAWAPNSKLIATASTIAQGSDIVAAVLVWDSDTGKLLQTIPQNTPVQGISFAPDAKSLAVLDVSGQLHVWQLSQ